MANANALDMLLFPDKPSTSFARPPSSGNSVQITSVESKSKHSNDNDDDFLSMFKDSKTRRTSNDSETHDTVALDRKVENGHRPGTSTGRSSLNTSRTHSIANSEHGNKVEIIGNVQSHSTHDKSDDDADDAEHKNNHNSYKNNQNHNISREHSMTTLKDLPSLSRKTSQSSGGNSDMHQSPIDHILEQRRQSVDEHYDNHKNNKESDSDNEDNKHHSPRSPRASSPPIRPTSRGGSTRTQSPAAGRPSTMGGGVTFGTTQRPLYRRDNNKRGGPSTKIQSAEIREFEKQMTNFRPQNFVEWREYKDKLKKLHVEHEKTLKEREEEEKKMRKEERKAAAEKVFEKWKEEREKEIKTKIIKKKEHTEIQQKLKEEQKENKRHDADKIFQVWVEKKTERARSLSARKKRREETKAEEEKRKKEEKQADAAKVFAEWKRQKAEHIEESEAKKQEKKELKAARESAKKEQKRREADEAYKAWLEAKDTQKLENSYNQSMSSRSGSVNNAPAPWLPASRTIAPAARVGTRTRRRSGI